MKDQVTSLEQSQRLLQLGVPASKARMRWERHPHFVADRSGYPLKAGDEWHLKIGKVSEADDESVPAFTVGDLLGVMPPNIEIPNATLPGRKFLRLPEKGNTQFQFHIWKGDGGQWSVGYISTGSVKTDGLYAESDSGDDLVQLLFERIVWLVANDYKQKL